MQQWRARIASGRVHRVGGGQLGLRRQSLSASFHNVNDVWDSAVRILADNAVGWGPWSALHVLGGV